MNTETTTDQVPGQKGSKKKIFIILIISVSLLLLLIGVFSIYSLYSNCGTKRVSQANEALRSQEDLFNDTLLIAMSTSRIALSGPVTDLQSIKRDTDDLNVPVCMETAKFYLLSGMESYINGFLAFMSQASDTAVALEFDSGDSYFYSFNNELERISTCAPFCKK